MKNILLSSLILLAPLHAEDLVWQPLETHVAYREAVQNILLYAATAPFDSRTAWQQALTPITRHLSNETTCTLRAEPPFFDEHQEYDLAIALQLANEDSQTPPHVLDALLTIAAECVPEKRLPHGEKPRPLVPRAVGELSSRSRQIARDRRTLTQQRYEQELEKKRRQRRLEKRKKRAEKCRKCMEERLAAHLGGQEVHDERQERDLLSSQLRAKLKEARNAIRQAKKNKVDAVRTEHEKKVTKAEQRAEARRKKTNKKLAKN